MPTPKVTRETAQETLDAFERCGRNESFAARFLKLPRGTVSNRLHAARLMKLEPTIKLPRPIPLDEPPRQLTGARRIGMISDIHAPYHDLATIHEAIGYWTKRGVDTIILNGDIIDNAAASDHEKTPQQRMGFTEELAQTREVLGEFRRQFPDAEIIYNEGNHEARLPRWLARHAPELWALAELHMPRLLRLDEYRIQWSPQMQRLSAGELTVIHGHEYRKGGIHIAYTTGLAAAANIIQGNFHRSQESIFRSVDDKVRGSWAVGCACQIHQPWLIYNQWVQGFAWIDVADDGTFLVENRKVIDGRLY